MIKIHSIATLFIASQIVASAQEEINLRVSNFARPLAEKWATEYAQQTGVKINFVGASTTTPNTISLVTSDAIADDEETVYFGRYAVLPVVNKDSEAEQLLSGKRLNAKKLKNIFFVKDEFDDDKKESKAERELHIYSGNGKLSVSRSYATHFSHVAADYKGKRISGDDIFLNSALSRDPLGITINTISNIFDLNTRQLRSGLSLVSLDLGRHADEVFDTANLDNIIALLESDNFDEIAIGNAGLAYDHNNTTLNDFVRWILTNGNQYVHEFGLLQLTQKDLATQMRRTELRQLALK